MKQPETDKRTYKHFTLDNGLVCLLVSDPETDRASAAMDVHVGSFHEPLPGLSHFLEHVLFLGTKKYPQENDFSQHLSNHGGHSNAYTSSTNTNYYFEVAAEHLESSLDRFAQFFIEPLFSASGVDREMNAVDSEYKKNLTADSRRIHALLQSVGDSEHPYSRFHIGNLETLSVDGVLDKLKEHYENTYSANLMRLVVLAKESVDVLEPIVKGLCKRLIIILLH